MRELRQQKKDDRMAAKAAILKEKAERKAARKAATEAKRLKVSVNGGIFTFRSDLKPSSTDSNRKLHALFILY